MAYCEHGFALSFGGARLDGSSAWRREDDGTRVHGHVFQQSSFASRTLAAASSAVVLDRDLPLELAPAFGCGVSTGAASALNVMDLRPGSRLAVLGTGTVGLAAVGEPGGVLAAQRRPRPGRDRRPVRRVAARRPRRRRRRLLTAVRYSHPVAVDGLHRRLAARMGRSPR